MVINCDVVSCDYEATTKAATIYTQHSVFTTTTKRITNNTLIIVCCNCPHSLLSFEIKIVSMMNSTLRSVQRSH